MDRGGMLLLEPVQETTSFGTASVCIGGYVSVMLKAMAKKSRVAPEEINLNFLLSQLMQWENGGLFHASGNNKLEPRSSHHHD